jgi:tRNA(fMet)-specific endonuclease VapC
MYFLDSDHMSLLERGGAEGVNIRNRLRNVPPDDVATTIINYEEQIRGWMARLASSTQPDSQMNDYSELKRLLNNYCRIAVVEFDEKAVAEFKRLRQESIRIGTMVLKIAAIALANGATIITRNAQDFSRVPDLKFGDWSV